MPHTKADIQKAFNDTVGAVLVYLDEAQVGLAIKKAVKAEIYELCDKKIQPWFKERDEERGGQLDDDTNFNR